MLTPPRPGHRLNMIMWNYNRAFRNSMAYRTRTFEREYSAPDAQCVSYTHDRDFEVISGKERPEARFAITAWCPPPQAEYEGFSGAKGRYARIDPKFRDLPPM